MVDKIYTWYTSADRYLRKYSAEEVEDGIVEDVVVLREEEVEGVEELDLEIQNQRKPRNKKVKRPSILLEALKKVTRNANENEDLESYGSNGERIQCRGPT
jgi:hypothetical protein